MKRFVSRKLAFAGLLVVVVAVLAALGALDQEAATGLLRWVATAYLGGQAAVDVADRWRGGGGE